MSNVVIMISLFVQSILLYYVLLYYIYCVTFNGHCNCQMLISSCRYTYVILLMCHYQRLGLELIEMLHLIYLLFIYVICYIYLFVVTYYWESLF